MRNDSIPVSEITPDGKINPQTISLNKVFDDKKSGVFITQTGLFIHFKEGRLHREDGPALCSELTKTFLYYINGLEYKPKSDLEWLLMVKTYKEKKKIKPKKLNIFEDFLQTIGSIFGNTSTIRRY
jgi:hypothetical protein